MIERKKRKYFEPKAFLRRIKNVEKGLNTRSEIVKIMESKPSTVSEIAEKLNLSYGAIREHLIKMLDEGICTRTEKIPYKYSLTGIGQKSIKEFEKWYIRDFSFGNKES